MKHFLLLPLLLCAFAAFAQVPQSFNYQAIARDKDGKPISAGDVTVTARILRNGTEVYSEQTDHTTSSTGLFTLRVGEKDPTDFQAIDWALGGYTLQVSVGGAIAIQTPAVPIVSVPYAIMADEVAHERQQLVLNGNQLTITGAGGNTVTLAASGIAYQAGAGIGISNNTITNTGDTDPTDDLTKTSAAGGDVSGTFSALSVDQIKGRPVASTAPQNGQVLKWDTAAGAWKPDNDLNTVGSGNTATAAPLLGDGSAGSPVRLAPGSASGQVLKWNGTAWIPAADETGMGASNTYAAGTGISITGSSPNFTINNTGDTNAADDLTNVTNFGGDVSGTYNNLQINANAIGPTELANGAVTVAKIAQQGATAGQVLKWNGTTWSPQDDIGGGTGDGWGSQTAVTGAALTGNGTAASPLNLAQQGATNGQVLKWNGTTWSPLNELDTDAQTLTLVGNQLTISGSNSSVNLPTGTTYSEGQGIDISPINMISVDNTVLTTSSQAGGNVTGVFGNLQIGANTIGSTQIADGSITPVDLAAGLIPTTLPPSGAAGGDLTGTYPNPTVAKIQGKNVASSEPTIGQVLQWNGSAWIPTTLPTQLGGSNSQTLIYTAAGF